MTSSVWFHLREAPRAVGFIETESRGACQGLGRRGDGDLLVSGYGGPVLQDEKSAGGGWCWWLHAHVRVLTATELYVVKL